MFSLPPEIHINSCVLEKKLLLIFTNWETWIKYILDILKDIRIYLELFWTSNFNSVNTILIVPFKKSLHLVEFVVP